MRKVSTILFVLAISVITIVQSLTDLRNHVQRTMEFQCKHPQLRSIPIRELLPQSDPEAVYYPAITVLARCDEHSGCCLEDQICKVAHSTTIELVFTVNHMIDKSRPKHYEIIQAQNHTRCHCVNNSA